MLAPPLVFNYIGVVFAAISYGLYALIFGIYWHIKLKRADGWNCILLYGLTANFILCTAYLVINIIEVQFIITIFVLNDDSLENAGLWLAATNNALYTTVDFISQFILLYRCWIMWRQLWIMVFPCMLTFACLATALTTLSWQMINLAKGLPLPDWYFSAVTAFFFISWAVNVLVTALIIYKITIVYQGVRGYYAHDVQPNAYGKRKNNLYSDLILILVESGIITFVAQLLQAVLFKFANPVFPLVSGAVVMLYGISTTVVLVRVEMGVSYDHIMSRTANSTYSAHPMKFKPSSSNLDETTIAELDYPNDTHLMRGT